MWNRVITGTWRAKEHGFTLLDAVFLNWNGHAFPSDYIHLCWNVTDMKKRVGSA